MNGSERKRRKLIQKAGEDRNKSKEKDERKEKVLPARVKRLRRRHEKEAFRREKCITLLHCVGLFSLSFKASPENYGMYFFLLISNHKSFPNWFGFSQSPS